MNQMPVLGVIRVMNTKVAQTQFGPSVSGLGSGSAVISYEATEQYKQYHPDANVWVAVTNHHVVGSQSHVMCNFHFNLMPFPARVYKINPNNDIAFLIIDLPHEQMGNHAPEDFMVRASSTTDVVGTQVTLVGYPLGTECQTITRGSIASFNVLAGNLVYENTALCNPGNSGGAMMADGKLLGINTAIMNPGSVVTIAKPWTTVKSLLTYIKHDQLAAFKVFGMDAQQEHRLRGLYNTTLEPEKLLASWQEHCEDEHGNFKDWVANSQPELVSNVLHLLQHAPEKVHGFTSEPHHATRMCPELIVFDSYFQVTPTLTNTPSMKMVYPSLTQSGAMISSVGPHEAGIQVNDVLVAIDGNTLDNYGRFEDGMPYFTAFKYQPATSVNLTVARQGEPQLIDVKYRYDRIKAAYLPKIHASVLTPNERHAVMPLGGLTVVQMTLESAVQFGHQKYTRPENHNDLVFVVPSVNPASQEWLIQRISPGSLMTHIDNKPLSAWGNNDKEVWSAVNTKMKQNGVQHVTVTFECRMQGEVHQVQNVYAVANIENHSTKDKPCQCKICV